MVTANVYAVDEMTQQQALEQEEDWPGAWLVDANDALDASAYLNPECDPDYADAGYDVNAHRLATCTLWSVVSRVMTGSLSRFM